MKPVPGLSIENQPEDVVLAMCLYGEARGEATVGKLAVAWVIKNRAQQRGSTIKQECLRPYQFSSFNDQDVNRGKLLTAYKTDPANWARCECVADILMFTMDPTHGADHYYAPAIVHPTWGEGNPNWIQTAEIGAHKFGKAP